MKYYFYKHTSPSGKVYIGETIQDPIERWGKTTAEACRKYQHSPHMVEAIKKYGWENFTHEILETIETDDINVVNEYEIKWILHYQANDRNYGYNSRLGNAHGALSEEHKLKIGKANKGRLRTEAELNHLRTVNIGRKRTQEEKDNISQKMKELWTNEDFRQKMIDNNGKSKRVICVETGIIYKSASEAARAVSCDRHNISRCCNHQKGYNTSRGYHWEWYDESGVIGATE